MVFFYRKMSISLLKEKMPMRGGGVRVYLRNFYKVCVFHQCHFISDFIKHFIRYVPSTTLIFHLAQVFLIKFSPTFEGTYQSHSFNFRLLNLIGEYTAAFDEALVQYSPLARNYTEYYLNSTNKESVEETRRIVMSDNFTEICRAIPEDERRLFNFTWFAVNIVCSRIT